MIAYFVSKRGSSGTSHTKTVIQPKVKTESTTTNTPTLPQKPHSAYSPTGPIDIEPPTTTNTPTPPQKPHSAYSPTGPIGIELPTRVQNPAIGPDYPPQDAAYSSAAQSGVLVNQPLYETVQDTNAI